MQRVGRIGKAAVEQRVGDKELREFIVDIGRGDRVVGEQQQA